jgi:hypothetical protein
MTAFPSAESYEWSNGKSTQIIKVTEPGTYYVKGITENGCESVSQEIVLEYSPIPEKPSIKVTAGGLKSSEAEAYQWYLNGNEIVGANEQYYLPEDSLSGNFTVEIFNQGGCSSISDEFYHKFTDIEEYEILSQNFAIVPNPNYGNFDLVYKNIETNKLQLIVTDIKGQIILDRTILISSNSGSLPVEIRNSSSGVYFLNIKYDQEFRTLKIITKNE